MTVYRFTTQVYCEGLGWGHTTLFERSSYPCDGCGGEHPLDLVKVAWDDDQPAPDAPPEPPIDEWFDPHDLTFAEPLVVAAFLQRLVHMV